MSDRRVRQLLECFEQIMTMLDSCSWIPDQGRMHDDHD